jgi:hypothetical protein
MLFIKVPEAKAVKNRVHLDPHADDREAEVERLVALARVPTGRSRRVGRVGDALIGFAKDPDGHLLELVQA